MPFTIHREPQPDRLIRMGHAPVVIEPEPKDIAAPIGDLASSLGRFNEAIEAATNPPPEPVKNKQGRPKKMAKENDFEEVETKTIRKDDAGEQGAIGSHGVNAPAQDKVPEKPAEEVQANG